MEVQVQVRPRQVRLAEANLSYTEVRAPFDGTVADVFKELYESVAAGEPVVTVYRSSRTDVLVNIPDILPARIHQARDVTNLEARAVLEELPDKVVWTIKSHYVCSILLLKLERFIERNITDGVITPKEAQLYLDRIKRSSHANKRCDGREDCIANARNEGSREGEVELDGETVQKFVHEYNQRVAPLKPGEREDSPAGQLDCGQTTKDGPPNEFEEGETASEDNTSILYGEESAQSL